MDRVELSPDGCWRWDGVAWVPADQEPETGTLGLIWRAVLLGVLPALIFEVILFLVPVWAPDESWSLTGALVTLPFYALFVASPGLVLAAVTKRNYLLFFDAVVLCGIAAWAAIAMIASDDAQAGLAVLIVWMYGGVPLLLLAGLVELISKRSRTTR